MLEWGGSLIRTTGVFIKRGHLDTDKTQREDDVERHRRKTAVHRPARGLEQTLPSQSSERSALLSSDLRRLP